MLWHRPRFPIRSFSDANAAADYWTVILPCIPIAMCGVQVNA